MELNDYLKIGEVCEVQGKTIRAGVYSDKNTEYLNYKGAVIKNVGIGSFVLVRKGFNNIIGKVEGEYIKESTNDKQYSQMGSSIKRIVSISVLGSLKKDKFVHGLTELPLIGNFVFILEENIVDKIFSFHCPAKSINLGKIIGHENYSFRIGIQEIACSHVGIFGNTGSGKSNTLAKIYNEIISEYSESMAFKRNSKFVVFDFNGEYSNVFPDADEYVLSTRQRQGDSTKHIVSDEKKYPISIKDILNPETWAIVLEATEKTQKPFIKRCIRQFEQLKDGKCIFSAEHFCDLIIKTQAKYPELKYIIGDILDVFGLKKNFDDFDSKIIYNGQSKQFYMPSNYTITSDYIMTTFFQNAIFNREGINKLSIFELFEFAIKYNYWLEISRSYITKEHIAPLVSRTGTRCEDMQKIFDVLSRETYQNLQQKQSNVEVISFLDLNLAMKKIVPMIIAKVKYSEKKAQKQNVLRSTLHFIIDEAHNILSDMSSRESEEWKDYRLESFEEIIKEGRKFGTFLTIASQRPSDISDTIISQLHNYFIHRLVNEEDLRKMYRSVAFADKASNDMIPILPAGGCLVSGLATSFPVLVQIDLLTNERRPKSENVNIETVWEDY